MRKIFFISITTIIILGITSCASKKNMNDLPIETVVYGLRKGACFGTCPAYNLFILKDGRAVLDATHHMDVLGLQRRQLSQSEMKNLENVFKGSYFHTLQDSFPSMSSDLPAIWITHHDGESSKTVYGKEKFPKKLINIKSELEKIAESGDWQSLEPQPTKPEKPTKPESNIIKDELIVLPQSGQLTEEWFSNYKVYGLKMIKKLSPDLDYYLLGYNEAKIDPDKMVQLLKDDPVIKLVELNKKIKKRKLEGLPK